METKSDSFFFQEQDQTAMNTSASNEIMASCLDSDDFYNPSFTQELPFLGIPNEHLLQVWESDFNADPSDSSFFNLWEVSRESSSCQLKVAPVGPPLMVEEEEDIDGFIIDDPSMFIHMDSLLSSELDKDRMLMKEKAVENISATAPEVEEEVEVNGDHESKEEQFNCKNLVSERNRRKRISQQLLALRALVPNITKMDKRSILVDALNYLRSIHEEIAQFEKQLPLDDCSQTTETSREMEQHNPPSTLFPVISSDGVKEKSHILEIETERIEERRFVVKISGKGGVGIGGELAKVMESLGFDITFNSLELVNPHHVRATTFIEVKNTEKMTEEKLKERVANMAFRSGMQI